MYIQIQKKSVTSSYVDPENKIIYCKPRDRIYLLHWPQISCSSLGFNSKSDWSFFCTLHARKNHTLNSWFCTLRPACLHHLSQPLQSSLFCHCHVITQPIDCNLPQPIWPVPNVSLFSLIPTNLNYKIWRPHLHKTD